MKIASFVETSALDLVMTICHNSSQVRLFDMYIMNMHACMWSSQKLL